MGGSPDDPGPLVIPLMISFASHRGAPMVSPKRIGLVADVVLSLEGRELG